MEFSTSGGAIVCEGCPCVPEMMLVGVPPRDEFSSSGFTTTLSTWAVSSKAIQVVRQKTFPHAWLQLSVRIFAESHRRRHFSFPERSVSVERGGNYLPNFLHKFEEYLEVMFKEMNILSLPVFLQWTILDEKGEEQTDGNWPVRYTV